MSFYKEPLHWIREAMESILNQSFKDFEAIIICDNPDYEEAVSYIEHLQENDQRIRLICNPKNIGLTRSLNMGIDLAAGEYIARMDADDIALPLRLERQVAFMDSHPDICICATDAHIIDDRGAITRHNRYAKKTDPAELLISNILAHPSVMMRKSLLDIRRPLYNEDYIYSQDYELWHAMFLKGIKPHTLKEPLLLYRKSWSQISVRQKDLQVSFFKKAHKSLITNWLIDKKIIKEEDREDLKTMLRKASAAFNNASEQEQHELAHIIYVLYFSLGTSEGKYKLLYLFDRNFIAFRIKSIFTFRLIFSHKTRRNRTGFI